MKNHTTFRVGGCADYFVCPRRAGELREILTACREQRLPWFVMGNGSNLLVGDGGYRGVIVQLAQNFSALAVQEGTLYLQAGVSLGRAAKEALQNALTGLEFAAGIPGTVGGALVMNAGAYGGEMKDVVHTVTALTPEGETVTLSVGELAMGYRTSLLAQKGYVVLETRLHLRKGETSAIRGRMEELRKRRAGKQPLEYPSAGSTFKRPPGYFAGQLIMDAGLSGFRVGGAQVSKKHCGFIINSGDATALEVRELMDAVTRRVWEHSGVRLEPEIKMLGEF